MEILSTVLPIVIDVLIIVLLTVLIIVGLKLIGVMNKADRLLNNIEEKVNTFNSFFGFMNVINEKFAGVTEKVATVIEALIQKVSRRKPKKVKVDEEETEEDEYYFDEDI
jgi:hypothetical protein